ncbi:MAG: anti-sigma factor [Marmoricola sp.]
MNESLHALSGAYVVDALDDHERAIFEKHLPGCLDCQAEVASLREATALMADDAALTPPDSLRSSVLAGIKTIRPLPPETGAPSKPEEAETAPAMAKVLPMRPRRRRIATLVAAAAAVVAIGGGLVFEPWQDNSSTTPPQLSAADQVLAASDAQRHSIEFDDGSTATVVRSMNQGKAVLLTRNMAAPPPGKAFEVWLQDATGAMIPAGMMRKAGDHKLLLEGDAAKATGVGITVEPESGSETPTTQPIALFELKDA